MANVFYLLLVSVICTVFCDAAQQKKISLAQRRKINLTVYIQSKKQAPELFENSSENYAERMEGETPCEYRLKPVIVKHNQNYYYECHRALLNNQKEALERASKEQISDNNRDCVDRITILSSMFFLGILGLSCFGYLYSLYMGDATAAG